MVTCLNDILEAVTPRCSATNRSSRSLKFLKTAVLKKLRNINRKTTVLKSLFNKAAGLQVFNCIKKRLQHNCFPMNIAKFFRAAFFIEILRWLLLNKVVLKNFAELTGVFLQNFSKCCHVWYLSKKFTGQKQTPKGVL